MGMSWGARVGRRESDHHAGLRGGKGTLGTGGERVVEVQDAGEPAGRPGALLADLVWCVVNAQRSASPFCKATGNASPIMSQARGGFIVLEGGRKGWPRLSGKAGGRRRRQLIGQSIVWRLCWSPLTPPRCAWLGHCVRARRLPGRRTSLELEFRTKSALTFGDTLVVREGAALAGQPTKTEPSVGLP